MTVALTPRGTTTATVMLDIKTESLVLVGASGLTGAETVAVEVEDGLGGRPAVVQEEVSLELVVDNNVTHLRGPGQYYLSKPTTAEPTHLFMYAPARAEVEWQEV